MNFSVASCCMFCQPVSYAFAISVCSPIAIGASSCVAAAAICRLRLRYPSRPPWPPIVVNTAVAAPCEGLRFFPLSNFLLGCPTPLPPRTLHDHPRRAPAYQPCPSLQSLWPNQTCAYPINPARNPVSDPCPAVLSETFALAIPASSLPPDLLTATHSTAFSKPTTPQPHSKHI